MVNKSIARKEFSRLRENGQETIVNDYIEFEMDKDIYATLIEIFDDYEYAEEHGVFWNQDDDIHLIEVDKVVEELDDRMMEREADEIFKEKLLREYLYPKFKGYTIWI